ncbi:MAG: hypothetical protein SFZ24_10745 [Planctomycetota bacterium]|nr:hypothetical protein [Planctomycetota bacterium]
MRAAGSKRRWLTGTASGPRIAALLAALAAAPCLRPAPARAQEPGAAAEILPLAQALSLVRGENGHADRPTLVGAFRSIVREPRDLVARGVLFESLWADQPPGSRYAAATAIAELPEPSPELAPALGGALQAELDRGSPESDLRPILAALSHLDTPLAAAAILSSITFSDRSIAPEIRDSAYAALVRLTGRADLGREPERWRNWWADAGSWTTDQWQRRALAAHARNAESARLTSDRLVATYRRLHAVTPEAERGALLAEMLRGEDVRVRRAALELIQLALVNAKPAPEGLADLVTAQLAESDAGTRADAAEVLELLAVPAAREPLVRALDVERDPRAAGAMLRALARQPDAVLSGIALGVARAQPLAREAACAAVLICMRQNLLAGDVRDAWTAELASADLTRAGEAELRLAVRLGLHQTVASLLASDDETAVQRAASALEATGAGAELLLSAAAERPALFAAAARAVRTHLPTAQGYAAAAALPAPTEPERAAALDAVRRALPPAELRVAASSAGTPAARAALLAHVAEPDFLLNPADAPERIELAIMLARALLRTERGAETLALLDSLPSSWQGPRLAALRLSALLCLARIDEADNLLGFPSAPSYWNLPTELAAEAWLDAIAAGGPPQRLRDLRIGFLQRFDGIMTQAIEARWNELSTAGQP